MAKVGRPRKEPTNTDELFYSDGSPRNQNVWSKDVKAETLRRQIEGSYEGDNHRPGSGMYAGMANPHEFLVFYREAKKKPHCGSPWAYGSAKELEKEIDAYFDFCIHRRIAVSVAGLGAWLGISVSTMSYWKRNRETHPFYEVIEVAIAFIHSMAEQGALDGNVPANVFAFISKNYHGMKDIQEYAVEPVKQLSITEQDKIIDALPE